MYLEYDPELVARVKRLHFFEHYSINATARTVGLHRSAVRGIVGYDPPSQLKKPKPKLITAWIPYIEARIKTYPKLPSTTIFRNLKAQGYKGSVNTVRRAVREIRPRTLHKFRSLSTSLNYSELPVLDSNSKNGLCYTK